MKFHARIVRSSIISKLILVNTLILLVVGGIVAVNFVLSRDIGREFITLIDHDVTQIIENAALGKNLNTIFSETQLLVNTFIENPERPTRDGERLLANVQRHLSQLSSSDVQALHMTLEQFQQDLKELLDHCVTLLQQSERLQQTEQEQEQLLQTLEETVTEILMNLMMEGREDEMFAVQQISVSIPDVRNTLLHVQLLLHSSKRAHLAPHPTENEYEQEIQALLGELQAGITLVTTAGMKLAPLGEQLLRTVTQYQDEITQLHELLRAFQTANYALSTAQERMTIVLQEMNTQVAHTTFRMKKDVNTDIQASQRVTVTLSIVFAVVLVLAALYTITLVTPLRQLASIAEQLAEGKSVTDIPDLRRSHAADELGTLSRAFQRVIAYNQDMAAVAKHIAQGNLSQEVHPRSQDDVLGQAFLSMSNYLNHIAAAASAIAVGDLRQDITPHTEDDILGQAFQQMTFLRESIREIMRGATQLKNASRDLSRISEQMVTSTQHTSQQTYAVSSNSNQISENVSAVAQAADGLSASIGDISQNTSQIVTIADSAVEQAKAANSIIEALATQSQEIGDIITVITSVSQQTNLLALNATIEAARAGDFGKGFAVVANEIKELSRETAASAEDIIRKLERIQAGTSAATTSINEVLQINTRISSISSSTAVGVQQQTVTTNEIATRMSEAAVGSHDITQIITNVASYAKDTSEGAIGVQYAAQELASLAEDLQHLVEQFKIE